MLVNIGSIKGLPGTALTKTLSASTITDMEDSGNLKLLEPVMAKVTITNTGSFYLVCGEAATVVQLECSRCLRPYRWQLCAPLEEEFYPVAESRGKTAATDLFAQQETFHGDVIDLTEAVREQLILGLPVKTLCREDCPGLCPHCGIELANGKCDCKNVEVDPRLAPLAKLLQQNPQQHGK